MMVDDEKNKPDFLHETVQVEQDADAKKRIN